MAMWRLARSIVPLALAAWALGACAKIEIAAPHQAPIPTEARMLLGKKHMKASAPIFVRIFKAESELEVWKQREDGNFYLFKTYPICHWSGDLGPKRRQGDKQSPEGFYRVNRHQMNPNSKFHLSFDLGYPNAYDRAHGRTGDFLMVHGKCKSAGCYAMTDGLIEEIYALAREALAGGQEAFQVHAFPFRMTEENLARYQGNRNNRFWQSMKKGYDYFNYTRKVPNVEICARQYHVNVEWNGRKLNPKGRCPRFRPGPVVPFVPMAGSSDPFNRVSPPVPATLRETTAQQFRSGAGQRRMSLGPARQKQPTVDPVGQLLRQ